MARINIHLGDVDSSGFVVLPEDNYIVQIQESSKIVRSKNDNLMIKWFGKVIEGNYEGKMVSWQSVLTPESYWFLKAQFEAINQPYDEDGFELEDWFGVEIGIINRVRTYEDSNGDKKEANNITGFFNPTDPEDPEDSE